MQIKAYSVLETIFILFIITSLSSIFLFKKPYISKKDEIVSLIIHSQFYAIQQHERIDIEHSLIEDVIWFNMSGNVNEANTIEIIGSNEAFTIMLHTGRIRE
jgi:hypothetical protein